MNLIIMLAVAFALLVLAILLLNSGGSLPQGKLPNGKPAPVGARYYAQSWTKVAKSIPAGQTATFILAVTCTANGQNQAVNGRPYIAVVRPGTNVSIVSVNGTAVNSDNAKVVTAANGTITFVVRNDKASEQNAVLLVGRDHAQIKAKRIMAQFAIPGAP